MITLTDNALLHLRKLIKEHNKNYVRLQVKGGGCAGFEYESVSYTHLPLPTIYSV